MDSQRLSRRACLSCGVAVILCLGMGTLPGRADDISTIRVGIQSVPTDDVYAAKDWGAPFKVKVELTRFSSGADMLQAFLAGRIDVADGGSARLVTLAALRPTAFYIIATNQSGGDRYSVFVNKDAPYKSVRDLIGKKIGAVTGSGSYNTFLVFLQKHGMKESDFQIVNMKVEDLRAAVQQHIVDAAVGWEPNVAIAEMVGGEKRIQSMAGVNESPNFVLVSRSFAAKNPEAVTRYVASLQALAKFIETEPAKAGDLAARQMSQQGVKVDPKALEVALTRIKMNPDVTDALLAELVPIAESMKAAGRIPAIPDFKALVRTSFLTQARKLALAN